MIEVEICINASDSATVRDATQAAYQGGASRIELCGDMQLQGLTPAASLIEQARLAFRERRGLLAMIRPRGGDFCYTPSELKQMRTRISEARRAGADGVVLGVLRHDDRRVHLEAMRDLMAIARDHQLAVTFHRALDATPDAGAALQDLIDLGVSRVLTAGIPWGQDGSALQGAKRIGQLARLARGRVEIVVAGGVSPENVPGVLQQIGGGEDRLSVHAYSSVQQAGITAAFRVRALVDAVRRWEASRQDGSRITPGHDTNGSRSAR